MGVLDDPRDGTPADAPTALTRPDDLVVAIARFLHSLHTESPDPDAEPATAREYLALAEQRCVAGMVDPDGFDTPYRRESPERLLSIAGDLADRLPDGGPVVPVHGGLALADLRVDSGVIVGWSVPSGPLAGDRYVDLAFLACDLATAIGPAAVPALFDAAGVDHPEPFRLEFWVTIRQLL